MGIFSLFGKKDQQAAAPADKGASRAKRDGSNSRPAGGKSGSRVPAARRDAQAALDTALKIDAIESEMSSEFVTVPTARPRPMAQPRPAAPPPATAPAKTPKTAPAAGTESAAAKPAAAEAPAPELGNTTEMLLDGQTAVSAIAQPFSDAVAAIEEAAILYANGQHEVVEQMLSAAIADDCMGEATARAWLMQFDLYQITGKQQEFERLAIEYANKFETSPPAWTDVGAPAPGPVAGTTPAVPFSGSLDAGSTKQIGRIQNLAANYRTLRLEFARVSAVDAAGCGLLLDALNTLQKSGHDLILVGAVELADKIRGIIEVGRRDDSESAWLLLLEILRLLKREQEFEEVSIDYCVTFEVSPPAYAAPQGQVTTAASEATPDAPEAWMMPKLVEGRIDELIVAIAAWSDEHQPAVIDCSRLQRVDFNAAGRLLTGLAPFCGVGKTLEFHHVNHLVAELFRVIGLHEIARILPRKS